VDTHGPRVSTISFEVISTDSSLASTLGTGGIQIAEWSFQYGSVAGLKSNPSIKYGTTLGYTFDGIAFNQAQPIINSTWYRRAIQYLTDYGSIQTNALHAIEGTAAPYLMPCAVYPLSCNTKVPLDKFSLLQAAIALSKVGSSQYDPTQTCPSCHIYAEYNGALITTAQIAKLSTSKLSGLSWFTSYNSVTKTFNNPFSPLFYYRNDDPLRETAALILVADAAKIGFTINANGIPDEEAGGLIYGASEGDVIQDGGYCASGPNAGYDLCPPPIVNETSAALAADNWDMYTFGWVTSSSYTFQGAYEWLGSQINNDNFNAFINNTMDKQENLVIYAPTFAASETAAKTVGLMFAQNLPSVVWFYEDYLYADFVQGWTGYAAEPTSGPNTVGGAYYTFLNVHPTTGTGVGGNIEYAIHGIPDLGALNPIAYPNWVWQADLYSEIYDAPLATPPTKFTTPGAFIPYMLSGSDPTAPAGSTQVANGVQVASFTGMTPIGAFNFQNPDVSAQANIVNGQAITFTFAKNITFSDNVPLNAYDYNYSLYALNVAISPSLPTAFSPFIGGLAGPLGLFATTVSNNGYSITMYLNVSSAWNIVDVNVPVLPMHVFNWLNINVADQVEANIDFSQPYTVATGAVAGSAQGTAPSYITYLNNINLGSGPFWLQTLDEVTGSGTLYHNTNYFRSAWYDDLKSYEVAQKTGTIILTAYPAEYIYNPTASTSFGVSAGGYGWVNMTSLNTGAMTCTASAQFYKGSIPSANIFKGTATGSAITLAPTCSGNGQITVSINPHTLSMAKGIYEVTVTGSYTFLGEARTWYQFYGIYVH